MQISILSVAVSHVPGKNGGYKVAEVAYKDEGGKVNGKKVMSFTNQGVFNTLSEAQQGDVFQVVTEKDTKGYWQWTNISKGGEMVSKPASTTGNSSPKSTYETPEERAKKQVYIVRQSSISAAIALLTSNGGKKNTPEEVLEVAKVFEAYVFDNGGSEE